MAENKIIICGILPLKGGVFMDNNFWLNGSPTFATSSVGFRNVMEKNKAENKSQDDNPYTEAQIEDAMNRYRDGDHSSDVLDIISYRSE